MSEYKSYNKLGVGEILICSKETNGKFESLKSFIGKVIVAIGGGFERIFVVEERDKVFNDVKSIQSKTNFRKRDWDELPDYQIKSEIKIIDNMKDSRQLDDVAELRDTVSHEEAFMKMNSNKNISEDSPERKSFSNDNNISEFEKKNEIITSDKIYSKPISLTTTAYNKTDNGFIEKGSQIIQIVKGKHHLLKLTYDGKLYASGISYYGVVGLGGNCSVEKAIPIPNLVNMKIVQVSCGMYHSLALNDRGDLYSWGMGFEGQLGLSCHKVTSSPRYVSYFYRKPVKFITCGHNFSLCITDDNKLWGWGENMLGQLGLGKQQVIENPTYIEILDKPSKQEDCVYQMTNDNERTYSDKPLIPCYASCGYAHSAIVTEEGYLVTFGLNIYGQLGLGNLNTSFFPQLIEKDDKGINLKVKKVTCNTSGTFIITEEGKLYSCGYGEIGHGELTEPVKLPKLVADGRVYSSIFSNENNVVAFCPSRVISISPNSGPATGNTIISIIGSAFKDFPKLSVRFIFGEISRDVKANFDKLTKTIYVKTPNFSELSPNLEFPTVCKLQVTFDGNYFIEYHENFLIYSATIKITGIDPKCGPTDEVTKLQINMNLDNIPLKYHFSLTIGLQARPIYIEPSNKKANKSKKYSTNISKTITNEEESKIIEEERSYLALSNNEKKEQYHININPLDITNDTNLLEKANWHCSFATYEQKVLTCNIPKIDKFNQNQVEYNVDVALNGQQFTGFPMIYRFYDIRVEKMEPNISLIEGGLSIKIIGTGLFDSVCKKAKISSSFGVRFSDLQWDRNEKTLSFTSHPLIWSIDEDVLKSLQSNLNDLYEKYVFEVSITMNNINWIPVGSYRYCDCKVSRISYIHFSDKLITYLDRIKVISEQENLTEEEKVIIGLIPPPTDKKKNDEIIKRQKEEDENLLNLYKRPFGGINLYGNFFPNSQLMKVRFHYTKYLEFESIVFYKNEYKVSTIIPEMPKLPPGEHELKIFFSVNSQQFIDTGKKILVNNPEPGYTFQDILKLEESDIKNKGKKKK